MTIPDFLDRLVGFASLLANGIVCITALRLFQETPRRPLLFIGLACGLGVLIGLLAELQEGETTWGDYYFYSGLELASTVLWLIGSLLLFQHYGSMVRNLPNQTADVRQSQYAALSFSGAWARFRWR